MLNKIFKSSFSRNVATLASGTIIAQAIPVAISPILTRLYTPDDFGILALLMSIVAVFSSVVTAKYDLALLLPKKDDEALKVLMLIIIIVLCVSFASLLVIGFWKYEIATMLKAP